MDDLTEAVNATDLPALVADMYPESGARPGKSDTVFAVWRGNTNTPSFSLYRKDGVWFFSDKATGEGGNAFAFLTKIAGLGGKEAGDFLRDRAGVIARYGEGTSYTPRPKPGPKTVDRIPLEEDEATAFLRIASEKGPHRPEAMKGRGFRASDMDAFMIVDDGGDARIPMFSPEGELLNIKRRFARPKGKMKYRYEMSGHGSPPWVSPNLAREDVETVLVCEGELNGMIAYSVLSEAGVELAVMGVAGAEGHLYLEYLANRTVYVYGDGDDPGVKARERRAEEAKQAGASAVYRVEAFEDGDFCDQAAKGRTEFGVMLDGLMSTAEVAYDQSERRIGAFTIKEIRKATERRINGEVIIPTGFRELDAYTGGLPESDLTMVGALPSMGKSAWLRQVIMSFLDLSSRNKVLLFSPDQSAAGVFRLLASLRSGVPIEGLRNGYMPNDVLNRYGSFDAAKKAWWDSFDDGLLHLSKRLIISEKQDYEEVRQEIWQQVESGVGLIAFDYIQLFEYEDKAGRTDDRRMIKELKMMATTTLKVPMLMAVQLAKTKFGQTRRSGIPIVSDVEGTGRYHQLANQIYLIYNQTKYIKMFGYENAADYAAYDPTDTGKARVIVAKNKEGDDGQFRYLRWDPGLVRFHDMI